jgi:hypothetical protein
MSSLAPPDRTEVARGTVYLGVCECLAVWGKGENAQDTEWFGFMDRRMEKAVENAT